MKLVKTFILALVFSAAHADGGCTYRWVRMPDGTTVNCQVCDMSTTCF